MKFSFSIPEQIIFGGGSLEKLSDILGQCGYRTGALICDPFFAESGLAARVIALSGGKLTRIYHDIQPNPTTKNVDDCANMIREMNADFAVALGGGSTLDCAKAACLISRTGDSICAYHTGNKPMTGLAPIDLIAVPTTAGTGSEVTWVSVLSDPEKQIKAPLGNKLMLPKLALIDYELTMSIPSAVTASTGIDVLSHAVEGFWSIDHQPICDALAIQATKLVFQYLPRAFRDGSDKEARENMSLASLLAGLAFGHPKTTGSHACSFPLTNRFHVPHGEACAFTLDSFMRINADCENGRIHRFARDCGFEDAFAFADAIEALKHDLGLRTTLTEIGIPEAFISELCQLSKHPNLLNNPVRITDAMLEKMYCSLL